MENKTWWANVRTGVGSFIQVKVQAPTQYNAQQILEAQYGDQLISNAAYDPQTRTYGYTDDEL